MQPCHAFCWVCRYARFVNPVEYQQAFSAAGERLCICCLGAVTACTAQKTAVLDGAMDLFCGYVVCSFSAIHCLRARSHSMSRTAPGCRSPGAHLSLPLSRELHMFLAAANDRRLHACRLLHLRHLTLHPMTALLLCHVKPGDRPFALSGSHATPQCHNHNYCTPQ